MNYFILFKYSLFFSDKFDFMFLTVNYFRVCHFHCINMPRQSFKDRKKYC